jgi:hypothetical protein
MNRILFLIFVLLSGCGSKSEKFPVSFSCGSINGNQMEPGLGITIDKDKAVMGAQSFIFQKQDGNLRRYKDNSDNTVLSFDVVSEGISLLKYEGDTLEGILQISKCTKK